MKRFIDRFVFHLCMFFWGAAVIFHGGKIIMTSGPERLAHIDVVAMAVIVAVLFRRHVVELRTMTETLFTLGCVAHHVPTVEPEAIVHALSAGYPVCAFSDEPPVRWPAHHYWAYPYERDKITCPMCQAMIDDARAVAAVN